MTKKKRPTTILFVRGIPLAKKNKFHSIAVERGDSIQTVIEGLMTAYIQNPGKFEGPIARVRDRKRGR